MSFVFRPKAQGISPVEAGPPSAGKLRPAFLNRFFVLHRAYIVLRNVYPKMDDNIVAGAEEPVL
ncbi:MAG: hypothetical protein ACYS8Y_08195 [Planctomycetota bacterium]